MKLALTLLCSLLLLWGQVLVVSASPTNPATACHPALKHCCCHSTDMSCCERPSAPEPVPATAPVSASHQLLNFSPTLVLWIAPANRTTPTVPAVTSSLTAAAAPIFARHCVWLI